MSKRILDRREFLAMATALGRLAEAGSVRSIDFREGRLNVKFRSTQSESQRTMLSERADALGLAARFAGDSMTLTAKASP